MTIDWVMTPSPSASWGVAAGVRANREGVVGVLDPMAVAVAQSKQVAGVVAAGGARVTAAAAESEHPMKERGGSQGSF